MDEHVCQCSGPGHCPVFNRQMTPRSHQVCSNTGPPAPPGYRESCLRYWRTGEHVKGCLPTQEQKKAAAEAAKRGLPGTAMAWLLKEVGVSEEGCATCEEWVQLMDEWGVEGCRARRAEIIERLQMARKELLSWSEQFWIGLEIANQPWFRLSDRIGCIVDESIRRADRTRITTDPAA